MFNVPMPDGTMGVLSGFGPGGQPFVVRQWRKQGFLDVRAQRNIWHASNVREIEALIRANREIHRKAGMKPYSRMFDKYDMRGKTWVICGAGPSLREQMRYMDQFCWDREQDIVFVAINRALQFMVPHIFFTIDRVSDPIWWEGIDRVTTVERPILVTAPMCDTRVLEVRWRDMYHTNLISSDDGTDDIRRLGWLESNRTAVCSAMDLAARADAERIILIGLDCALDAEMRNYWNSPKPAAGSAPPGGFIPVVGINGKLCWINNEYHATAGLTQSVAMMIEHETDIPVYNSSEQGILMHRNMPLPDALSAPTRSDRVVEKAENGDTQGSEKVLPGPRVLGRPGEGRSEHDGSGQRRDPGNRAGHGLAAPDEEVEFQNIGAARNGHAVCEP